VVIIESVFIFYPLQALPASLHRHTVNPDNVPGVVQRPVGLLARQTEMLARAGQRRVLEWLPACLLAHLVAVEHGDALGVASIGRAKQLLISYRLHWMKRRSNVTLWSS